MKKKRQFVINKGRGNNTVSSHTHLDILLRPPSPCRLNISFSQDTLTYAQSQKMVEAELEGRIHRINIFDQLAVITDDEMLAQDLAECNSNKENSEQIEGSIWQGHTTSEPKCKKNESKQGGRIKRSSAHSRNPVDNSVDHSSELTGPLPKPSFRQVDTFTPSETPPLTVAYYRYIEKSTEELETEAEYDMDEEDMAWLQMVNRKRVSDGHASVSPDTFELLIDRLERESILESRSQAISQSTIDEDAYCCVCLDDECLNSNVILFCDICNLAVHQECYGVPYIPEGQWLCRRCLQSPSRSVNCVLCPNRGGAFKQASDGRWAHVVCAIWIPEVCFANTVFLEPVEGISNIPHARWKLICYLCKQKGCGASIQCHKANCYRAFHVTCAQRAGLFMKIEPVKEMERNSTTFVVKKTAFCGNHSPDNSKKNYTEEEGGFVGTRGNRGQRSYIFGPPLLQNQSGAKKDLATQQKKKTKKISDLMSRKPMVIVPQIPSYRLNKICTGVSVQRKNQFMQRLHNYWLLKRHSRNGVPLIRRLHSHLQTQTTEQREPDSKIRAVREELKYWQKLRQDLEKARLLIELIRKRERLKREQLKLQQVAMELQLTPALVLLRSTLEQLQDKDTKCIFNSPVKVSESWHSTGKDSIATVPSTVTQTIEHAFKRLLVAPSSKNAEDRTEAISYFIAKYIMPFRIVERPGFLRLMQVPDYLEFVSEPMDFSTMREKLEAHSYQSVKDLEADFNLMVSNCLKYNSSDTVFHKAAKQLQRVGGSILRQAQRQSLNAHLDIVTGMHLSDSVSKPGSCQRFWDEVDSLLNPENRSHMSSDEQLQKLLQKLDIVSSMCSSGERTKRIRLLRQETNNIRHKLSHLRRTSRLLNGTILEKESQKKEQDSKIKYETTILESKKSTFQKNQEPTNPTFSPLPEDAPPNSSVFCLGTGLTTISKQFNEKQKSRCRGKRKDSGRAPNKSLIQAVINEDIHQLKEKHTLSICSQEHSVERFVSLENPAALLKLGVGRRTSILFKKTKNGDMLTKSNPLSLQNEVSPEQACDKIHQTSISSPQKSFSSSSHHLRSRGPSSVQDSDIEKGNTPNKDNGITDDIKRHRTSPWNFKSGSPTDQNDSSVLLVPSRGKGENTGAKSGESKPQEPDDLDPLSLVWAKCSGYPSYPAMTIDPHMPKEGILHNGIQIPVPHKDVLKLGKCRQMETRDKLFLVLFFDTKRTWQWLPLGKLHLMGVDDTRDKLYLKEGKKSNVRKSVRKAYDRAMAHLSHIQKDSSLNPSSFL